jgi:hypothetical protein
VISKVYQGSVLQDNCLDDIARGLEDILMKKVKIIRIQAIMPKTVQKQTGLDQLSDSQLANLNAWLNLPKTKAVLGPGPIDHGPH